MLLNRRSQDFWAGLLFMGFGVVTLVMAWPYPSGNAARMGPGYFPRILGIALMGLGSLLSLRGCRSTGEALPGWRWRPTIIVLLSVAIFALTAKTLGLVIASLALVFLSSVAHEEFRWKEALISSAIQAVSVVVVFVYGLGVPFSVWPAFISGGH
jgi:hypothetical protein